MLVRIASLVLGVASAAFGQDVVRLYSLSDLRSAEQLYSAKLAGLWNEDFLSRVAQGERTKAGPVTLNTPLVGDYRHPLEFSADAETKKVFFPIASIKFVDDISVAFAFYDRRGCDLGTVSDYAATLRFQPRTAIASPLAALGVPASALKDAIVDDVSQKILKSTVFFFFAHEYAHVMYGHGGYRSITAAEAQRREIQADAFGLEILRRTRVVPMGLTFYFLIASRLERSPIEFETVAAYEAYLQERATHPLSSQRISSIARGIASAADDFAAGQPNPAAARLQLQSIAAQLQTIGNTLDDRAMSRLLGQRAATADIAAFQRGCQR